ncbi:MAG: energy transducer TonB [Tepidisphaeraceae bacterium]|jgi:protein TonB
MSYRIIQNSASHEIGLLPAFTLVLWLGCLAVGLLDMLLLRQSPAPPTTQPQPTQAQLLDVDITQDASPPQAMAFSAPSPLPAFAAPAPAIAFALPLDAPPQRPPPIGATVAHDVQRLTFGEGEGRQPAPEYPLEAVLARQEGVVLVLFTVDPDGRVTSAEAIAPSPWPILNQAAVRCVRDQWRFPPGAGRSYEVSIEFRLNHP